MYVDMNYSRENEKYKGNINLIKSLPFSCGILNIVKWNGFKMGDVKIFK